MTLQLLLEKNTIMDRFLFSVVKFRVFLFFLSFFFFFFFFFFFTSMTHF